jgi:hypothetical protein
MEFEFLAVAGVDDAFGPLHVPGRRGGMSNTQDSFGAGHAASDHRRVAGENVVGSGRTLLHAQALSRAEPLGHSSPKDVFRLWFLPGHAAPAGVQAVQGVPAKASPGLVVTVGGFLKELVEL